MTSRASTVAAWFGLQLRPGKPAKRIGHPPTHVCFDRGGVVWVENDASPGDVLHECCHAVLGPYTLTEEYGLMAYELACARLILHGEDRTAWRSDFAGYALDWGYLETEVGDSDEVFESEEWIDCETDAFMRGWLKPDGSPVQFSGVSSEYRGGVA